MAIIQAPPRVAILQWDRSFGAASLTARDMGSFEARTPNTYLARKRLPLQLGFKAAEPVPNPYFLDVKGVRRVTLAGAFACSFE